MVVTALHFAHHHEHRFVYFLELPLNELLLRDELRLQDSEDRHDEGVELIELSRHLLLLEDELLDLAQVHRVPEVLLKLLEGARDVAISLE